MNIFIVDADPQIAARELCDKHVVKMVLESAQLLSNAHRVLDGDDKGNLFNFRDEIFYKKTHTNHPCAIWCRETSANYQWLYEHYRELAREYQYRYGKRHASFYKNDIGNYLAFLPKNIRRAELTPFAIAMKQYQQCIVEGDPVQSYRNYYNETKMRFANWKRREPPLWANHLLSE